MGRQRTVRLALALVVAGSVWIAGRYRAQVGSPSPSIPPVAAAEPTPGTAPVSSAPAEPGLRAGIGFRDPTLLRQHYQKHGVEFGRISETEYLRRAQRLRDRVAGGDILEAVRADGVITRFDRASGSFLAFDRDLTIRTFFRPNDGERYFRRQLARGRSDS